MSPTIATSRSFRVIPSLLSFLLLPGLALALLTMSPSARAQETETNGRPTKEAQALLDALDDIDLLRSLTPLKLTPDQIDKLVAAIGAAKADYDKQVTTLVSGPVVKLSDEIRAMHKQALAGKGSTKEFDDKIKKMQSDFLSQRDKLNQQNILRMSGEVSKILTSSQRATVAKMEKDVLVKLNNYREGTTEAQLFNAYVVDVFINTGRIVPILKDLKAATEGN
ncbi:MAG TPA: hypothetical protein VKU00_12415 [Chthonomonadaceae bacterium]|nr:hypothetical protein [Chthonomonadaceae bacterium]